VGPSKKEVVIKAKKESDKTSVLYRHRRWLEGYQTQKMIEKEEIENIDCKKEILMQKLKLRQEKKRMKLRSIDDLEKEISPEPSPQKIEVQKEKSSSPKAEIKPVKLTEKNVKKHEKKPKWA